MPAPGADSGTTAVVVTPSAEAEPERAEPAPEPRLGRELLLDLVVGAAAVLGYLVVQLSVLQGPRALDPARYFDTAVDFPNVPVDLWTLRVGLIAPVRVAVLVFGPSEAAFYAVPIAAGMLLTAAVYGTMLLLFRDRVLAAAAALVTVLSNVYLFTGSAIYPDTTAAATLTAGFFFLVLAATQTEHGDHGWLPLASVVAAGVLFGSSYLIREFSPFLLPAVVAAVVLLRYSWRRAALLAGAAVATASLELLYGAVRFGEPFIHLNQLLDRNHSGFSQARAVRMDHIQSQLDNAFDTILVFPRLVLAWRTGWLFLLVLLIFIVALVLVRDRRFWLLAVWCASFWAIMTGIGLGELPSGRWILNITNIRYWYPMLPALVMAAFGGLWLLVQRWIPTQRGVRLAQATAGALAFVILVPGIAEFKSCSSSQAWWNDPAERWQSVRSWFSSPDAERYDAVWTDAQSQRLVPAYIRTPFGRRVWGGRVKTFSLRQPIRLRTPSETSLILVHKARLRTISSDSQERLNALRADWTPVFTSSDGEMVLLAYDPDAAESAAAWWDLSDAPPERADPGACGRSPYEVREA
jgi:hypothetical protein